MKTIDVKAFNKGLCIRTHRTEKWEKGSFDMIESFLNENCPVSPEMKSELPQFIFNALEGAGSTTLKYPQEFLVTEIDLPTLIKEKVKDDPELAKHWRGSFRSLYRRFSKANIPYWLMYITPSGMGLRFVIRSETVIQNEIGYKQVCLQFLKLLEPYGITEEYHDLVTINRGWYFPVDKRYFDVKGESFKPDFALAHKTEENQLKSGPVKRPTNREDVERLIGIIDKKDIDITFGYDDWVKIGFALSDGFGEEGRAYFHSISRYYQDYIKDECDRQYDACLKSNRGETTVGSLFYIAKKYGVELSKNVGNDHCVFWERNEKGLKINYSAYFDMLHSKGIGRLQTANRDDVVFVHLNRDGKTVRPIDKSGISEFTVAYIRDLDIDKKLREEVENAYLADSKILMPKNYAAVRPIEIDFVRDTSTCMCFFFKNVYVEVDSKYITVHGYNEMDGFIWESQIIPFEFNLETYPTVKERSEFCRFIKDVTSDMRHEDNDKRFQSLRTAIGYLLHTYKDPSIPRSVVFMDASIKSDAKGRTGKGIVKNAISKMRKMATVDGKRIDFRSKFCFSQVTIDTDILFIDDIAVNFDFKNLFSALTEGVVVERKFENESHLSYEDSPKVLINTNYAIQGSGDSFEGRIFEFEFSDYYSASYNPEKRFGHLLFNDWDKKQWNLFYNFMLYCGRSYLKKGLIQSQYINLAIKKIALKTGFDFIEYLRENIKIGYEYNKAKVFEELSLEYPIYKEWSQKTFTINLCEYFKSQKCEVLERKSGKNRFFRVIHKSDDLS